MAQWRLLVTFERPKVLTRRSKPVKPCIIVVFHGYPCLVSLGQARKNYRKWKKGSLGQVDVIDVAVLDRVDWTGEFREELKRIRQKLPGYPERGRPIEARGRLQRRVKLAA